MYERYATELRHFAIGRTQSAAEADEIVQETFLRYHAIAKDGAVDQPRGLLYRIATNLAADYHRRNARRGGTGADAANMDNQRQDATSLAISLPDRLEDREALNAVLHAIDHLPKRARQVFLLRRIDALTYRQISTRMGISEKTVEKHLAKAVRRIADAYDQHLSKGTRPSKEKGR